VSFIIDESVNVRRNKAILMASAGVVGMPLVSSGSSDVVF
jgi:hypothetical protein